MIGRYREREVAWNGGYPAAIGQNYFGYTWLNPVVWVPSGPPTTGAQWPLVRMKRETCDDSTNPGPPYRTGGPLYLYRYTQTSPDTGQYTFTRGSARYVGRFQLLAQANTLPPGVGWLDTANLSTYGPTGYAKFKPGKPTASASVFLAELRELTRQMRDVVSHLDQARLSGPAGNWLASSFGWAPMIRDLRNFFETYKKIGKALKHLRDYNGKYEHRGGTVAQGEENYRSDLGCYFFPTLPGQFYPGYVPTPSYVWVYRYFRVWFEATFYYNVPNIGTQEWEARATRALYGIDITPSAVWELIPWSWLLDWFSNFGDFMSAISPSPVGEINLTNAFVMRYNLVTYSIPGKQKILTDSGDTEISHDVTQTWELKERALADPTAIGLTIDDLLSMRQSSILAALAVQRLKL